MSGIEIAGLVVGVIPLVVEVLKHYKATKSRFVTFARHAEVAWDIQLKFQIASANFNNDCRLLLQSVVAHSADVSEMIQRPTDRRWQEQGSDIEKRLRGLMEGDYDLCENIITRVRDILREVQESLVKLDRGLDNTKLSHHELAQKIWHAFNTSRKENEFTRQLESLDKWNKALGKLRKQRSKIEKRRSVSSACIVRKAMPRSYQQIHVASEQLAESLHDSWSCTNVSHSGHQAKLSLDARSGHDDVQLDIVVACHPKLNSTHSTSAPTVPIWLQIRSFTSLPTMKAPASPLPTLVDRLRYGPEDRSEKARSTLKPKSAKSKKRVRFNDPGGDSKQTRKQGSVPTGAGTLPTQSFVMLDLKTTKSVCCHVSQVSLSPSACQDGCVGYLDVQAIPTARLIFYDASKLATREKHPPSRTQETAPIIGLVNRLQILQQITLAHKLAEAVLQYHSTSWLPQAWTLQDVAYFKATAHNDAGDITDALQSLHFSKRFPDHRITATETTQNAPKLKHTYGIRNLTLAKLGVALLEICSQRDMTTPSLDHTPHEVFESRKLLDEKHSSIMTLGNRYLEVVRKCIYCDFSCDDDLSGEALQSAVYTEVVCVLQEMKSRWEKFFGI